MLNGLSNGVDRKSVSLLQRLLAETRKQLDADGLQVSVIDGGDQMIYSDTRDRRGWAQPLAASQALQDANSRRDVSASPAASGPRVVRALAGPTPGSKSSSSAAIASPYQFGKAQSPRGCQLALGQLESKTANTASATHAHFATARSR